MNVYLQRFYGPRMLFSPEDGSGTVSPASGASAPGSSSAESTSPAGGETNGAGDPPAEGGDDAFSGFGNESDDGLESVELTGSDPVVPPVPAVTPAPVVPPPAAASTAPAAPAASAVAAAPSAKDGPPPSPIATALEGMQANTPALTAHMAQTLYALSPEEITAFETDAVGMIPKLMAKVHMEATKNTLSLINKMVPGLIDSRMESTTSSKAKATEALNEFYSTNSDLNAKDHGPLVDKWAKAFRAQNPTASRQEAIQFVGQAIRTEKGLPALVPGAPSASRVQPFAPARPGAKAPTAPIGSEANPFAALGMDIEE